MTEDAAVSFFHDRPRCKCAVVGVYHKDGRDDAALFTYGFLAEMYTRGEEGTGVAVWPADGSARMNDSDVRTQPCAVYDAFGKGRNLRDWRGRAAIGHNRYATVGPSDGDHAQPFLIQAEFGSFAIAHNGTIRNAAQLQEELFRGETLEKQSDTWLLAKLVARGRDLIDGLKTASQHLVGSYSLALLARDGIYAVRDPHGMKPLCIGRGRHGVYIASESAAFNNDLGIEFDRDLKPGEIFHYGSDGEWSESLGERRRLLDIFELVYFARPDSVIDGIRVGDYRTELGRKLAERDLQVNGMDFFGPRSVIVPVPYSGLDYGIGYHEGLTSHGIGIPHRYGLFRRRPIDGERSFIQPSADRRSTTAARKLAVVGSMVDGKRVFLVDDSSVRGTTDRKLAQMLRRAGAMEIHKRNGFPPVIESCPHGGIDMKTREEHIAVQIPDIGERAANLGYDSILHNEPSAIIPEGMPPEQFCTFCYTCADPFAEEMKRYEDA